MTPEKQFEERIKRWFHQVGIYPAGYAKQKMKADPVGWYFKHWGGGYAKSGIPDIIACICGVMFGIELKAPKGRATDLQKLNISRINDAGGIGVILYPSGFDEFKSIVWEVIECSGVTAELILIKSVHSVIDVAILKN